MHRQDFFLLVGRHDIASVIFYEGVWEEGEEEG